MKKANTISGFIIYASLCFIPLFIMIINSLYYNSELDTQFSEKFHTSESFLSSNLTDTLSAVRETGIKLIDDYSPINYYFSADSKASAKLVLNIKKEVQAEKKIEEIFFYSKEKNAVISNQGVFDSKFYFKSVISNSEESYNSCMEKLSQTTKIENLIEISENNKDYILYTLPLDSLSSRNSDTDIFFCTVIDKATLFPLEHIYGDIYIFNSNGKLLLSYITTDEPKRISNLADIKNIGNSSVVIQSEIASEDRPSYTMYTVSPKNLYKRSVNRARNVSLFIIILDIIVSFILLFRIAKKNYKPIINTMKILDKNMLPYEYSVIETSVKNLLDSNKTLSDEVAQQKELFRDAVLSKLLNNDLADGAMFITDRYGVSFPYRSFIIIVLDLYSEENNSSPVLSKEYLSEAEDQLCLNGSIPYILSYNNKYVCILNTTLSDEMFVDYTTSVSALLTEKISTDYAVKVIVGVSNIHSKVSELPAAYLEAFEAVIYSAKDVQSSPVFFKDVTYNLNEYFSLDAESKMISYILDADSDNAIKTLDELFSYLEENNSFLTEHMVYDLICMLLKFPGFLDIKESDEIYAKLNIRFFKPFLKDIPTLRVMVEQITKELIDIASKRKQGLSREIMDIAIDFIHENYADSTLSIYSISSHVNLSTVQFTSLFKKSFNTTPAKYLNQYRIDIAKKLLEENKLSINEIFNMVGYTNLRTFNRLFKQYTNLTASEYRKAALRQKVSDTF